MKWISVKDQAPPRDRNILVYDSLEWLYVGKHEKHRTISFFYINT